MTSKKRIYVHCKKCNKKGAYREDNVTDSGWHYKCKYCGHITR